MLVVMPDALHAGAAEIEQNVFGQRAEIRAYQTKKCWKGCRTARSLSGWALASMPLILKRPETVGSQLAMSQTMESPM